MKKKHLLVALTFALGLIAVPAFAYAHPSITPTPPKQAPHSPCM